MPSSYRRGSPYTPGQYPIADGLLGMVADPSNEIPIGQAAKAIVNPELLTAGGARVYQALKNMATKSKWAERLASILEHGGINEKETAEALNSLSQGSSSQIRGGAYNAPFFSKEKNDLLSAGNVGPGRIQKILGEVENTPLPETNFSSINGKQEWEKELAARRAAAIKEIESDPDATLLPEWAENSFKAQEARGAEREFERMRDWPNSPTKRAAGMSSHVYKDFYEALGREPENPIMTAVDGGKRSGLLSMKEKPIDQALRNKFRVFERPDFDPNEEYINSARAFLEQHFKPSEIDNIIDLHASGSYPNGALDGLMYSHKADRKAVLDKLRGEE